MQAVSPSITVFDAPGLSDASVKQSMNRIDKDLLKKNADLLDGYDWLNVPLINATNITVDELTSRHHINEYRTDLNVFGDANITGDLNVSGDANFLVTKTFLALLETLPLEWVKKQFYRFLRTLFTGECLTQ